MQLILLPHEVLQKSVLSLPCTLRNKGSDGRISQKIHSKGRVSGASVHFSLKTDLDAYGSAEDITE